MMRSLIVVLLAAPAVAQGPMGSLITVLQNQMGENKEGLQKNDLLHTETSGQYNSDNQMATTSLGHNKEDFEEYVSNQKSSEAAAKSAHSKQRKAEREKVKLEQQVGDESADTKSDAEACRASIDDLSGSVNALRKALGVLKSGSGSVDLMQMNGDARIAKVISLLGKEGRSYGSKNAGVIDLVSDMHDQFKKELNEKEIACMNEKNNHAMQVQSLMGQKKAESQTEEDQKLSKAENDASAADFASQAAVANKAMTEDKKAQQAAESALAVENDRYAYDNKEYRNMIAGLTQAIATLKGSFLQRGPSFLQTAEFPANLKERVVNLLDQGALTFKSKALAQLAVRVSAAGGFKKIIEMIEDMVQNLQKEAAEDAAKNAGCVADLADGREDREQAKLNRDAADGAVNKNAANVDSLSQEIGDARAAVKHFTESLGHTNKLEARRKQNYAQDMSQLTETHNALSGAAEELNATAQKADEQMRNALKGVIDAISGTDKDIVTDMKNNEKMNADAIAKHGDTSTSLRAQIKAKHTHKAALQSEKTTQANEKAKNEEARDHSNNNFQAAQKRLDATNALCRPPPVPLKERLAARNNEIGQLQKVMQVLGDSHN